MLVQGTELQLCGVNKSGVHGAVTVVSNTVLDTGRKLRERISAAHITYIHAEAQKYKIIIM